jgi:signal transduction histidine kinase
MDDGRGDTGHTTPAGRSRPGPVLHRMINNVTPASAGLLAVVLVLLALPPHGGWRQLLALAAMVVLSFAPLVLRTRAPLATVAATTAIESAYMALLPFVFPIPITTMCALHSAALHSSRRRTWTAAAAAALCMTACASIGRPAPLFGTGYLIIVGWIGLATALGDSARNRTAYVEALQERAARAEATREEEARRRVLDERLRIARELHDSVAHQLVSITAQLGVARYLFARGRAVPPQTIDQAHRSSQAAMRELRSAVGLLRAESGGESPRTPLPGLTMLPELITWAEAMGITVRSQHSGAPRRPPAGVGLAAYRILQESLTNVAKHAGPRAEARMTVEYRDTALHLTVRNRLLGPVAPPDPACYGIAGMRERAAAVGGTLNAGLDGGDFLVEAHLPLEVAS